MQHQSNLVPRLSQGIWLGTPLVFKGSFASFWHDTEQKTALPVSKSVSLAKYPGANELRYRGAAKRKIKKTKQKKQRHAEHEKLARELVRERT